MIFFHQTKINQNTSLCSGFCSFDWKESRHICWGFLFSFCPQNWCHKSILLLIINPQGHERGGPCQNIKISSWACHSLSLSYIDYLGSRLCRLHQMYTGQFSSTEKLVQNWHIIFLCIYSYRVGRSKFYTLGNNDTYMYSRICRIHTVPLCNLIRGLGFSISR